MTDSTFKKGLEGIVFDTTTISHVVPAQQSLFYRGYPVHQLAERRSFEEVAYLILYGELPTDAERHEFEQQERRHRELDAATLAVLRQFPRDAHPMDVLRTVVSFLGTAAEFRGADDAETAVTKGIALLGKIPTVIAAYQRLRHERDPLPPRADLSIAENFFQMMNGDVPDEQIVKAFDGSLTLYAEHGFNASTFTARVIVSTQSDLCGAVSGAIAALKGSLHGGANEAVMHMLLELPDADAARAWIRRALAEKQKVMGFGHRLYRTGDSRVPTMSQYRDQLAELTGGQRWAEISRVLEEEMISAKGIHPNLDFPAGPLYYMMNIDIDLFTPIFVMARIVGWTAHVSEQLRDNRIVRPLSKYVGSPPRDVTP